MPRVPAKHLEGCDQEDLARMRDFSMGYGKFVGVEQIGDTRFFRFESPREILECSVKVLH